MYLREGFGLIVLIELANRVKVLIAIGFADISLDKLYWNVMEKHVLFCSNNLTVQCIGTEYMQKHKLTFIALRFLAREFWYPCAGSSNLNWKLSLNLNKELSQLACKAAFEREKRRGLKAPASTKRAPAFSFLAFRSRSRAPYSSLSLSLQSSVDAGWKSTRPCNLGYFSYKAHLVTGYSAVKLNAYKRLKLINNKVDNKEVCQKVTGERDQRDNSYIRFFNFIASRGMFITLVRKIFGPQKVVVVIESRTAICNLPYKHLLLIMWQLPFLDRFISFNNTAIAFRILVDEVPGFFIWRSFSLVDAVSGFITS